MNLLDRLLGRRASARTLAEGDAGVVTRDDPAAPSVRGAAGNRSRSRGSGQFQSPASRERARTAFPTVPADVLRQVRLVELRTRRLVNSVFAGEYRSVFKGQGMEFAEVREYQQGDEVRTIDWNVTARMGRPFVKRYVEERELTVMLVVDLSGSDRFGTVRRFKSEVAAELAAVLAMSAVGNNDRVGLLLFTDQVEHVVPPRKGRRHALRLLRDLMVYDPIRRGTDVAGAAEYLGRMLTHHAIIFILSDFQDEGLERPLKHLAQRHDVIAVTLTDPAEESLPNIGLARFRDPESGVLVDVDTSDGRLRRAYSERVGAEAADRRQLLRRLAIDEISVSTDTGYLEPLLRFFRTRQARVERHR